MKNIFKLITTFGFLFTSSAWATIYLVAQDAATHSVGMAAISSGPVVSYSPHAMNGIKGIGFTGWSGSVMNVSPVMDKQVFEMMQKNSSSQEIVNFVDSQIHEKYSRYIFISTQGPLGYVFPPHGCAEPECGVVVSQTQQFFVMGGGLKHDVVPNSVKMYEQIHARSDLHFECKLLAGLQTIINVGGEVKQFQEAGIAIDNPKIPQQKWFKSTGVDQGQIIANLRGQISKGGIQCPAMFQVEQHFLDQGPRPGPGTLGLDLN